ncbi:MAG: DNA polymerase III subunit gamma/tau [Kiritimatiellia bacterium]|nr:DNA polymerase III subunit gamma/tau [Lentisphaerota bacterium]
MAYEVLARKWRPQQFDDVVGQTHVTDTLKNAIRSDRVAHAYLFVGPRGVGKTTIARIFARDLNCVKGPTETACGVCDSCREISTGSNMDVQEIDGASNRRIEDVRDLRENARFAPTGRFKIYIIDEVHMLTTEAFNALLKILEEPPPHIKFFLATTDPQKIPGTILSRCQRFDLRRIPVRLIVERLELIVRDEKVEADHDALLAVARAADGGLRDAESALDQLISFQGRKISEDDVLAVFGLVSRQALETLAGSLLDGEILRIVKLVGELDNQGKDMQRLLVELLEYFRNLLLFVEVGAEAAELDIAEAQASTLADQAARADAERLLRMIDVLMDTADRLRFALSRRTLLETALIRCARLARTVSLQSILEQVRELQARLGSAPAAPAPSAPAHAKSSELPLKPARDEVPPPAPTAADELELLKEKWPALLDQVGRAAIRARGALLDAAPLTVLPDKVVIGIDREFADRIELLEQPRSKLALQKALAAVLRREVAVDFETSARSAAPPASGGRSSGRGDIRKWMEDKSVQKVLDVFNGSILEVRE